MPRQRIALPAVEWPDGSETGEGWADIKDPANLTNRDRKLLRRHALGAYNALHERLGAAGISLDGSAADLAAGQVPVELAAQIGGALQVDDLDAIDGAQAAFIVAYLLRWSYDRPLPTIDTVDDLPGPLYDTLAQATSKLGDGTVDTTAEGARDAASPTVPSAG